MFEKALRTRALASSGISAIVGTKIYVDEAPQVTGGTDPYPYIVIRTISAQPGHVFAGYDGLTDFRVQLDCYARTSDTSRSLANAVRNCFDGFRGSITVGSGTFDFSHIHLSQTTHLIEEGDDGDSDSIRRAMMDLTGMVEETVPTLT